MSDEAVVLDTLGEFCPVPVIRLNKLVSSVPPGTVIEVLSDDEGAKVDIPVWCRMKHQEFLGQQDRARGWAFRVRTT
jgi:cysteine desulfurase